jgi:hypothetical protein
MNNVMLVKVNADEIVMPQEGVAPVMATPAAFVAGVVMGGKAAGALVTAAGVGAAVAKTVNQ